MGGVYLSSDLISSFQAEDRRQLELSLLELHPPHLPPVLFSATEARDLRETVLSDLAKTLAAAEVAQRADPFRWLVQGDQRRHLDDHFEGEPEHRVHYLLPFFDRKVMELMMGLPVEWIRHHHLYMRWVRAHLPAVVQTPWQSYPDHEPCDLPLAPGINQWSREARRRNQQVDEAFARTQLRRWVGAGRSAGPLRRTIGMLTAWASAELRVRRGDALRMVATDLAFPDSMGGY